MNLRSEFLKWLQEGDIKNSGKFQLSDDQIQDFLDSAENREDPLWGQIEAYLVTLSKKHPIRTDRIHRDIKWLRKQAYKDRLPWGKK